jgi:hypothetical protein
MKARSRKHGWAVACVLLAVGGIAAGGTIYVDAGGGADFATIQEAIDDANAGDTVIVKDGTYRSDGNRDIDFKGKAITVRSEHGPGSCIIDCEGGESEQHMGFNFHSAEGPDSVLDGFTITGGYHEQAGAVLCTYVHIKDPRPSNPTIINCVMTNNRGTYAGAIRCNSHCEPLISDCVISENVGAYTGGVSFADESRPVIRNCIVQGNIGLSGGGIRTGGAQCHGTISNCLISGNRATQGGAGIEWWAYGGSVSIVNCTIADNEGFAGILIGGGGDPTSTITNCIVWGNTAEWGSQIYLWQMTAEVTYCDVAGGWPGEGNMDADPLFVDADGTDNVVGTEDDDLHLLGGSPCLDAGDNLAIPAWMTTDVEGNPRIVNGTVDMGAYEGPRQGLLVRPLSASVPEGGTAEFSVGLGTDPGGSVVVTCAVTSGDEDITIVSGAVLTFDSDDYNQPQAVVLSAAEDDDCENGSAVVTISAPGMSDITVGVREAESNSVLYVDADATGSGKGTSWAEAFANLQDALAAARTHSHITEIRVAQGVYRPDEGVGQSPGDRRVSFELVNGVTLKGGYAGFGEAEPDARDIGGYETILSGDLKGDDAAVSDPCELLGEASRAENSCHVVVWPEVPCCDFDAWACIDGFTITGGNANEEPGWGYWACGGGIFVNGTGNPRISNCRVVGNTADSGGGIWSNRDVVVDCTISGNAAWSGGGIGQCPNLVKGCVISGNYAEDRGAGVSLWEGDGRFEDCVFSDNRAEWAGGGMFMADAEPVVVNCTFRGNSAGVGGGVCATIFDNPSAPVMTGCVFANNTANTGGGLYSGVSYPQVSNCLFAENSAEQGGAVACFDDSYARLVNCTFADNSAGKGRALACDSPEYPDASVVEIVNSILWDGGDEIFNGDDSRIEVSYSDVAGGWESGGNIEAEPCFADVSNGNYHLKSRAGRWDPGSGAWVQDEATSPCIDSGNPASPIGGEPFPNGGIVNMGSYGGTAEASKSYFGEPVCQTIVAGDVNGDCTVNFADFAIMALHWLEDQSSP